MMTTLRLFLLLCMLFIISGGLGHNMSSCIEKERQALLDVKASLNSFPEILEDWGSEEEKMDCCKWTGVTCDNHMTGHVIKLDLQVDSYSAFTSKISPSLQVLNQLRYLDLSYNIDFQFGPLPDFLGSLSNLQSLHISFANLSGPIPHQLANLSNLLHLDLRGNSLRGSIPFSFGDLTSLTYLNLSQNQLGGVIPESFGNCSSLAHLDLSQNKLGGVIPESFGNCSSLVHLDLSQNKLGGVIPKSFENFSSLVHLDLSQNLLNGSLPNFVRCSSLIYMSLAHNSLNGSMPGFTGCTSLKNLNLSSNFFSGNIPNSVVQLLSNLESLDVSYNSLHGSILNFIRCSSLIYMSVAHNSLNGSMPDFTRCTSLQNLDLSSNFLSGNMPKSMLQISNLEYLNVSHNSLDGSIPNFIGCLSLKVLDMSSNKLFGNVPKSLGQVSNMEYLDFSSNSLKGVISDVHFLNLTRLLYLDLSFNSLAVDLSFHEGSPFQLLTIKLQSCKVGPKFPTWIKTQLNIRQLDISNAGISDSIPEWFPDFSAGLKFLNLSSNEIKGVIPDMIGSLGLGYHECPGMDLSNNLLEGKEPFLPPRLAALNLSGNRLSGMHSFLCEIQEFLTFLDLSNNSFSGSLPDCWLKFQHKLVVLNLSNNNLSGEIPSSLGFLSNLEALYLRTNAFVSEVPMSLSNCTRLRFVDLGKNKLFGVIPEWIGEKLSELYVLVLWSNKFYGRLPSQVCWLYNLQVFDVSNNRLSGSIPRCLDNLTAMARKSFGDDMTKHFYSYYHEAMPGPSGKWYVLGIPCQNRLDDCRLDLDGKETVFLDNALVTWKGKERSFARSGLHLLKSIDLSRNDICGILPYEITSLYDLASLNFSSNKLHGEVPKHIGGLKSLESLDLSRNELSGHIPWSLAQISSLSYLDLSNNNLSGRIPTGTQLQSFNYTSYNGNRQLCGPPLTPGCGNPLVVQKKDVEEEDDDFWKSYYMGMGAGFTVGFLGICGALVLSHRCRYFLFVSLILIKDWIYVIVVVHFGKLERKVRR